MCLSMLIILYEPNKPVKIKATLLLNHLSKIRVPPHSTFIRRAHRSWDFPQTTIHSQPISHSQPPHHSASTSHHIIIPILTLSILCVPNRCSVKSSRWLPWGLITLRFSKPRASCSYEHTLQSVLTSVLNRIKNNIWCPRENSDVNLWPFRLYVGLIISDII